MEIWMIVAIAVVLVVAFITIAMTANRRDNTESGAPESRVADPTTADYERRTGIADDVADTAEPRHIPEDSPERNISRPTTQT